MSPTTTRKRPAPSRGRKAAPKRNSYKRKSKTTAPGSRLIAAMSRHLSDQRHDVVGVGLVFFGILSGLGLYADLAGLAGHGIEVALKWLLGSSALVVPPVLAFVGIMVLRKGSGEQAARIGIGAAMTMLAASAFSHLLWASDAAGLKLEEMPRLGGVLGAGLAWPLERLLSVWGAGLFIVSFGFIGLLVLTKTPVSRVIGWVKGGLGAVAWALKSVVMMAAPVGAALWDKVRNLKPPALPPGAITPPKPKRQRRPKKTVEDETDSDDPPYEEISLVDEEPTSLIPVTAAPPPLSAQGYRMPPLDLLVKSDAAEISKRAIEETIETLEKTLQQFLVDARVTGYTTGPTVTRYEIELGPAVKVNRVVGLQNEIKYALASGELRILAPIPGKSAIGIEVPNRDRNRVTLGDVLSSPTAKAAPHPLTVGLGQDISGQPVVVSLADMPHLLIAGATGAGKSSCINAMLSSIIIRSRPDQVRLLLIDPKRVELSGYNGVPHLLTPVVTSPRKAAEALGWVVKEMEARYEVMGSVGMRHIDMYNEAVRSSSLPDFDDGMPRSPWPYYLVVVDELADLMMVAARDVEDAICRIAQMARAVGIHLVVATQRPSVDVVTGVIKANIPSRLAFATASAQDSRVILDEGGADRLIGKGDLLYKHMSAPRPQRIQGAWVSEKEIEAVVGWCRRQRDVNYVEGVVSEGHSHQGQGSISHGADDDDEVLMNQALELVVRSGLGSTSMLQRKLKVGFARAGRLMDLLEERGVVGPSLGSKPRDVLMGVEELEGGAQSPE
ncbi:MAG: DNA translocase FtsK 4TM domain-containing protein [Actinomycetota bacterium]|nr:DNA translocase FtsK [Actinomycetota bacterium]